MDIKHLLVHVDSTARSARPIERAVEIARRSSARLVGLFAEGDQLGASLVARRSPSNVKAAAAAARQAFEAGTSGAGIATDWWEAPVGAYSDVLETTAACCRYVDLAVFGQPDDENEHVPRALVEHVLLESGRPVLVVPAEGRQAELGKRVVVAWSSSRESSRALHDALPLMMRAESVHVVAFQRAPRGQPAAPGSMPALDVVAHLAMHGIPARLERVTGPDDLPVVDTLLNLASDVQADLVVMGAFGGRFPLPHFGRTTREVLRALPAPLLLSR
jgi:nucleotide-binding universal stress UspA family protein